MKKRAFFAPRFKLFHVRIVHNGSRASQPRARGTTRANCNPALDGDVSSGAPAFRRGVGCSLVPFTCPLASCSVCAQNESFIIVLRFWAKTAAKRPLPPPHQPHWRPPHAPARPSRALVAAWGRCAPILATPLLPQCHKRGPKRGVFTNEDAGDPETARIIE